MYGLYTKLAVIALAALSLQAEHAYFHTSAKPQGQVSQAKVRTQAQTEASAPPVASQTKTADPIVVTYQNGQLTINTQDATLADILQAVRDRTGALIDVPQGANERFTRHLGPGPVISVLGSLLNESSFNYLIEEFGTDQGARVRVALSLKWSNHNAPGPANTPDAAVALSIGEPPQTEEMDAQRQAVASRMQLVRQIKAERLQHIEQTERNQAAP